MTYEEVKEITTRLKPLGGLTLDIRLDNMRMEEQPVFYYYGVDIGSYRENNVTTVVKLIINEQTKNNEIWLHKCDYDYICTGQKQEQQEIYDTCQQIVRDYLNGNLIKGK